MMATRRRAWYQLLEKLQPLRRKLDRHVRNAGYVAAGPRQAVDQAGAHRIAGGKYHDGQGGSCLGCKRRRVTDCHDDIDLARN